MYSKMNENCLIKGYILLISNQANENISLSA